MSKFIITKGKLNSVRLEIERVYCEAHSADIDDLLSKHTETYVYENLIGEYWLSKGVGSISYVRINVYNKLNHLKHSPDEKLVELSAKFPKFIDKFLGYKYFETEQEGEEDDEYDYDKKIQQLKDKHWCYYYYDTVKDRPGISTGILYIDDKKEVYIKDYWHELNAGVEYEGEADLIMDGSLLLMELKIAETKERDLHIVAHIGNLGKIPQLLIGQYHNINHKMTIVSGTIIMADTLHKYGDFTPRFAVQGSDLYNTIPDPIRRFFADKENNRIKVPREIFSYVSLIEWLNQKRQKRPSLKLPNHKLKLFISAPTTSLISEKNYTKFQSILTRVSAKFLEVANIEVTCALLKFANYQEFSESNILLSEISAELNACDLFMMIHPKLDLKRQSSVLMELGYIMQRKIPKIIFVEDGVPSSELPNLLTGAIRNGLIMRYEFENFEDLISKIIKNGRRLFEHRG